MAGESGIRVPVEGMTLADLAEALTGYRPPWGTPIRHVAIDSRACEAGDLFIALPGERTDGHQYVGDAFQRGAIAAIVHREVPEGAMTVDLERGPWPDSLAFPVCFRVSRTLDALHRWAGWWRARFPVRVIGITGSVGKTSTKELTWAVLSWRYETLKSEGNLNSEIGLPLMLLRLTPRHQRAVLEMGMYARGEIAALCAIARPVIGVVTMVGPVHLERLGSLEAIAAAKAELVEALPEEGVAVLNWDDPYVRAMAERTRARVFFYGLDPKADLWADEIASEGLEGVRFDLHYRGETFRRVRVSLLGRHSVHTALRAIAVGILEGLSWDEIFAGLMDRRAQLRLVAVPGLRGSILLDDTYNASPPSMLAALNLLAELEGRKIAVLGDMLELGAYELEGHRLVGGRAGAVVDLLITVGPRARIIAQEAMAVGLPPHRVWTCDSNQEAIEVLRQVLEPGDVVLVKGSRGLQMEEIVNALCEG
ncbi:UDP-N-acetylmuramoyl-tripeptide--D-alanyl-D-alanine ligase [Thermoflexus sp.]|uniref:UDP-N-acetylmuramoyl-tripeptide--D-alanyl-D- alanine ligase n=1 Tax=Thermoflexus sp. TaxID=1969742 RepID=UPI0035E43CE6